MRFAKLIFFGLVLVCLSCLSVPSIAVADMEGLMPFAHIQYNSPGLDNSGPVSVDVFQNATGIYALNVSAFGNIQKITKSNLAAINGITFNAVGVSYSRGYRNTGGKSIYVLLYQVYSSGAEAIATVTVTEYGGIRVKAIRRI